MDIGGSTWVVTGASAGIGEAITRQAAARGAHVIGLARRADVLDAAMREVGGTAIVADLTDPEVVDGLVGRIEAEYGPVDVWVNNAGIETMGPLADATAEDVRTTHQLNLLTPIELCRQVIPSMEARGGGHVVNVSSMASTAGFPGMTLYCSTKAGLSNFTRVLRAETKGSPVGLTVVEIGPIPTDMLDRVYAYRPAERCFRRFQRLQVMPEVSRETVAVEVVDAVEKGRRSVRLPRRSFLFPWLTSAPQRLVDALIVGIRRDG